MAGAVAMASVIEDFVTPPCKKQRKDVEASSVKPITNYFLPMPKSTEKPFSPPRSSNIKDYFRRTLPSVDKSTISKKSKEHSQKYAEGHSSTETPVKAKPQKLRRCKTSRKQLGFSQQTQGNCTLKSMEGVTLTDSSCACDEAASTDDTGTGSVILGSETAVLLTQVSAEALVEQESILGDNRAGIRSRRCLQKRSKRRGLVKRKTKPGAGSSTKIQCLESPEESVKRSTDRAGAGDMSAERCDGDVEEASKLNDSTITISFEDFLLSQKEVEDTVCLEKSENDNEVLLVTTAAHGESGTSQKVSPRTLTIQAEVHTVSQAPELVRNTNRRLASIFTRRRVREPAESKADVSSCPQEKLDVLPAPKRKSNVVLCEEDLELVIIEPGTTSKCSQAERKQFMSAFRQPSLETGKGKVSKASCRQDASDESLTMLQEEEQVSSSIGALKEENPTSTDRPLEKDEMRQEGRKGLVKPRRGKKKKTREPTPDAKQNVGTDENVSLPDNDWDSAAIPAGSRVMRRSARSRPLEANTEPSLPMQSPVTRSQERLKSQRASEGLTQKSAVPVSTSKRRRFKSSVFRAEMLSPPDNKESPIRMRFRRVFLESASKSGDGSDFEMLSPLATNTRILKRRKQARKLLQRARVLQQSKNKAVTEDKRTTRRSLRNLDLKKPLYYDSEDSVVCLDKKQDDLLTKENTNGQKQLRSLNEVLGKAVHSKVAKSCTASKVAPLFLGKKTQKPSTATSIFDDISREGSDNSQDDEQFRARREFLKSGLPESFKKQMARTAANQDIYSTASTSFQPVVHVLQKPEGCPFWDLPWPASSLLKHLEMSGMEPLKSALSLGQFGSAKILPAPRACMDKGSGWREDLSESVCKCLLEEVRASNPQFPVRRFFSSFVRRRTEHLQQCAVPELNETQIAAIVPVPPAETAGRKQKRRPEDEGSGVMSKRRRSSRREIVVISDNPLAEDPCAGAPSQTSGRSRLNWTRRQGLQEAVDPVAAYTPVQSEPIIVLDDTPPGLSARGGCTREDVLWTEKYQPQHSSEVIGNSAAVKKLHSWLRDWKLRADREERRNQKVKKLLEDNSNDSWDSGDFQGEEGDEMAEEQLCNTLLITGPPGVGKTAAVYACAQELGFKVFEVNASSQRSGRQILSQLKEATQSHQVDIQGVNALKPSYFNNYSTGPTRPGTSPKKGCSPRRVVSSPKKPPQSPRSSASKKGTLAPTSLANYFRIGKSKDKAPCTREDHPVNDRSPHRPGHTKEHSGTKAAGSRRDSVSEEQSRKAATSLILFEEVDVIFDDDSGFLAAIKTFMATTKRPVILTTIDPAFSSVFDGNFEEIHFQTPSLVNVGSYLQLVCLAENVRTDVGDLSSLLGLTGSDVRQSLLHLQFWVRSGGGRLSPRPLQATVCPASDELRESGLTVDAEEPTKEKVLVANLPPCDTGCTESLLGLLNIEPALDLKELCKCKSFTEPEGKRFWDMLTNSWRRGMDLLYSNMEELLPLPVSDQQTCGLRLQEVLDMELHKEPESQKIHLQSDENPVKLSCSMRRRRRRLLPGQIDKIIESDSDSGDSFPLLCKPLEMNVSKPEETAVRLQTEHGGEEVLTALTVRFRKKADWSPAEQRGAALVSNCLDSIAEFLDHMSFLDSSLHHQDAQVEGTSQPATLSWTGAGMKSGLTDEPREEVTVWAGQESAVEIRAAVEGLSFQRCQAGVTQVWIETQVLEQDMKEKVIGRLSLPVASHRRGFSLCQTSLCKPSVAERRSRVLRTLSNRVPGLLSNKCAAATEYLPAFRTICRSERLKEQGKVKRRFLHYLDSIHLGLSKSTVQQLTEEFP